MISNFSELLIMASEQEQPQRLLMLFAKSQSKSGKHNQNSGTIFPVICVDKLPADIASFDSLVAEADSINNDWNFIIVAGLNGQNGLAPTSEDADPHLNNMTNALASGQDMSQYVIFDRNQNPVSIQAQ